MKVSSAEFIKNYGTLADKALQEPVTITKNGRDRLVVISSEEYGRLRKSDRRVIRIEGIPDEEMEEILQSKMSDYCRSRTRRLKILLMPSKSRR
jgi:PHD/YefM family antitoxin component YafN of YafNO toxin-antitoxin module